MAQPSLKAWVILFCMGLRALACLPAARVPTRPGPREPDDDAVIRALQAVDAPQCYFLPPAGPIPFTMDFSSDGTVKSVRAEPRLTVEDRLAPYSVMIRAERELDGGTAEQNRPEGPAVDCIAGHLRTLRIPPRRGGVSVEHVNAPHAKDLSNDRRPPFDRSTLLTAVAQIDLSDCATLAGPRRGEAMVVTAPEGGVRHVFAHGPSFGQPLGRCIEGLIGRVPTPSYDGSENWVLVSYTVPDPRLPQGQREAGAAH